MARHADRPYLFHAVWSPKYRRPVLTGEVKNEAERRIRYIAEQKGIQIEALAIMPDHLHVFFQLPRGDMKPSKAVYFMKWFSSSHLRRMFPSLRSEVKETAFWQRDYYCRTVGADSSIVRKYIHNQ
jgi:putative transposase